MKFLVLEIVTSMATLPDATSIEYQPLRQDMNIVKIFWKMLDPAEILNKNNGQITSQMAIPYNRIEINDLVPLPQAIQNLDMAVKVEMSKCNEQNNVAKNNSGELNKSFQQSSHDQMPIIISLHSTWDIRVLLSYKAKSLNFPLPTWLQHPTIFDLCKEYERWCIKDATRYNIFNAAALNINKRRKLHSNKIYLFTLLQLLGLKMEMYEMDEFGCIIKMFLSLYLKSGALEAAKASSILSPSESNSSASSSKKQKEDALENTETETDSPSFTLLDKSAESTTRENAGFTTPYDILLDYNFFLHEESKVVYLNNLPSIVTQSELEKWFYNNGCHPIGFWTVKPAINAPLNYSTDKISFTYVPDSDTISGYAVFQSHAEALAGLELNGKSLVLRLGSNNNNNNNHNNINNNHNNTAHSNHSANAFNHQSKSRYKYIDRVVEVQPSSNIVLTKIRNLLVPFPQTRNKPRPGDWNCQSCGFSNFQKRTTCFRCSHPHFINKNSNSMMNDDNAGNSFGNTKNNNIGQNTSHGSYLTGDSKSNGTYMNNGNNGNTTEPNGERKFMVSENLQRGNSMNTGSDSFYANVGNKNGTISGTAAFANTVSGAALRTSLYASPAANSSSNVSSASSASNVGFTNLNYNSNQMTGDSVDTSYALKKNFTSDFPTNDTQNRVEYGMSSNNFAPNTSAPGIYLNTSNNASGISVGSTTTTNGGPSLNMLGSISSSPANMNFKSQLSTDSAAQQDIPFRPGDWKCTNCAYHNFAKNMNCLRCNDAKL
ncbi:hypothetical protein ACO0RG_004334 [Hanseniaspora osmophila]